MGRQAQVILSLICIATLAERLAAVNINAFNNGLPSTPNEASSSVTVTPDRKPNGDVGFSMSGSAVRPPAGTINTGRPRPTVNDVIDALNNLTSKVPKEPGISADVTVSTNEPSNCSNPINVPTNPPGAFPPIYPTISPIYPPVQPPVNPMFPGVFPNQLDNNANQSIIILSLNNLQSVNYDRSSLNQLLSILRGKPGFVYVMTGGQGKFIPLDQLHLLPQNSEPSYVILLTPGRPNPVPGLQLINGLYPNGNLGNLGFQIPNLNSFHSLPIYVVQGYYPIWTILMNLGLYQPDFNTNYQPYPNPGTYPNVIDYGQTTTNPPFIISQPTNPSVIAPTIRPQPSNVDLNALIAMLGNQDSGNDKLNINKVSAEDVPDSELIKLLSAVLNEKPGSETEHIIVQEKKNPTKLLHILIELLSKKIGSENVVIKTQNENNPSKLLQVMIQLLRQKNASSNVAISSHNGNSEEALIKLLIKLIRQRDANNVVVTHSNNGNQQKLMQILMQLLSNQQPLNNILVSDQNENGQLIKYLIQSLGASNPEAGHILISGNNDAGSAQKLYNILLQMISAPDVSNGFGGSIYNFNGRSGLSGFSSDRLMQLVQILLQQRQSNPFTINNPHSVLSTQSFMSGGLNSFDEPNSKILTMLLGSGGGRSNKSALWSYLLGDLGCMTHNGRTLFCAK